MAERRLSKVRKGHQLILSDFENFDKNAFFFQEAQYLLETYYEDIDMFQSHFYPESAYQNSGLLAVPTIKNEPEILIVREFTAETLEKNGDDAIKTDPEKFPELRDFAADTLLKNGTDNNFTMDTLSDQIFLNIFEPENMAVFIHHLSETSDCFQINNFDKTNQANFFSVKHLILDRRKNFHNNNNKKFQNFRFFKSNCNKTFTNQISDFCARFDQLLSRTGNLHFQKNLGGRGHRFLMTVESHISRFKIMFNNIFYKNSFCAGGPLLDILHFSYPVSRFSIAVSR